MNTQINAGENLLIKLPLYTLASTYRWLGAYNNSQAYVANDSVLGTDNIAYVNILASTGNAPPNATYWTALPTVGAATFVSILVELVQSLRTLVSWLFSLIGSAIAQPATQTSGLLTIGVIYKIQTYHATDDFTNVGAASNAAGVVFTATGTTPTTWTNSSVLQPVVLVSGHQYLIESFSASDDFTNIGAASNATGIIFTATGNAAPTNWTHGSTLQEVSFPTKMLPASGLVEVELLPDDSISLSGDFDLRFTLGRTDTIYVGSDAQTDIAAFQNFLTINPPTGVSDPFGVTPVRTKVTLPIICQAVLT